MKKIIGKVLIGVAIVLVLIQFFQPEKNISTSVSTNAIEKHYDVPKEIGAILQSSCYDCHSNNTIYPWYNSVQPIAWWLQDHVNEAKRELNFDEFNSYTVKKKKHKLEEVAEVLEKDEMPLSSYKLIHRDAVLSPQETVKVIAWVKKLQQSIN